MFPLKLKLAVAVAVTLTLTTLLPEIPPMIRGEADDMEMLRRYLLNTNVLLSAHYE